MRIACKVQLSGNRRGVRETQSTSAYPTSTLGRRATLYPADGMSGSTFERVGLMCE